MSWGRFWGRGRFSERSASPPAPLSRRAAGVRVGAFCEVGSACELGRSPISLVVVTAALSAAVTTTPKQGNVPNSHGHASPKKESSLFPATLRERGSGGEALLLEKRPLPQRSPTPVFSEGEREGGGFSEEKPPLSQVTLPVFLREINQHLALSGVEEGTVIALDGMGEGCAEKSRVCSGGRSRQTGRLRTMP